jgi:hypothetical protein
MSSGEAHAAQTCTFSSTKVYWAQGATLNTDYHANPATMSFSWTNAPGGAVNYTGSTCHYNDGQTAFIDWYGDGEDVQCGDADGGAVTTAYDGTNSADSSTLLTIYFDTGSAPNVFQGILFNRGIDGTKAELAGILSGSFQYWMGATGNVSCTGN